MPALLEFFGLNGGTIFFRVCMWIEVLTSVDKDIYLNTSNFGNLGLNRWNCSFVSQGVFPSTI